ncbi:DUF1996 domain-containing protein [Streptomyces sp. ODS28]|uniref:DUF1996 domain-containing protein n=1 Tax=Streptomyces sp. ODS28 TaxID=3136688 RepID=UPI0031ECBDC6
MTRQAHKRSRLTSTPAAIAAAVVLGATGITALAVNASAGPGGPRTAEQAEQPGPAAAASTVACPDVGLRLDRVPRGARTEVAEGLAALDRQVAGAYEKVSGGGGGHVHGGSGGGAGTGSGADPGAVLAALRQQRERTIGGIEDAVAKNGAPRPSGLSGMSACGMRQDGTARTTADATPSGGGGQQGQQGRQPQQGGPVAGDFVDIRQVQPNVRKPQDQRGASKGTFTSSCGRNENGHFNSDNVIVAPGVSNGAHHLHDYVGNTSTDAFSTDQSLAAAGTTCTDGDKSTHYWPVLRALDGKSDAGAHDGNVGSVLRPASVTLTLKGSPAGKVTAMPRFLRIITGDAKAFTNGVANANASWSCEGFENRQLKDEYPLCPRGSRVVRTFAFQSCWDGKDTDSGNHRTHVAFAREDGTCPDGFRAIPQLRQRITYDVPRRGVPAQTPFAVDSFPEQLHKPVTDHGDFINVMSDALMRKAVTCINSGRKCG